jgi:hypothetical protein
MLPIVLTAAPAPERRGGTSLPSAGLARFAKEVRSDRFDPAAFEWPELQPLLPGTRARPTIDPRDGPVVGGMLQSKSHGVVLDLWPSIASNH